MTSVVINGKRFFAFEDSISKCNLIKDYFQSNLTVSLEL